MEMRILLDTGSNNFITCNNAYYEAMLEFFSVTPAIKTKGPKNPIVFGNNNALILPFNTKELKCGKYLKGAVV